MKIFLKRGIFVLSFILFQKREGRLGLTHLMTVISPEREHLYVFKRVNYFHQGPGSTQPPPLLRACIPNFCFSNSYFILGAIGKEKISLNIKVDFISNVFALFETNKLIIVLRKVFWLHRPYRTHVYIFYSVNESSSDSIISYNSHETPQSIVS